MKDWQDPHDWKPLVKEIVQKKDDMPLRTLLNQPVTKLEFHATIKSWSIITWLMDKDRDRFIEYLDQMKTNSRNQEAILQGLYKKGIEEIDEDWKAYVLRNY